MHDSPGLEVHQSILSLKASQLLLTLVRATCPVERDYPPHMPCKLKVKSGAAINLMATEAKGSGAPRRAAPPTSGNGGQGQRP